jgi:hypothetical protein
MRKENFFGGAQIQPDISNPNNTPDRKPVRIDKRPSLWQCNKCSRTYGKRPKLCLFRPGHDDGKPCSDFIEVYDADKNQAGDKRSQPQILVELAEANCEYFFKDQYGRHYALVQVNRDGTIEEFYMDTMPIDSTKFRRFLRRLFYEDQDHAIVGQDSLNAAIEQLCASAEYGTHEERLHLRVAWSRKNEEITYDLTNADHEYIVIKKGGWDITKKPDVLFRRFNQKPQVRPSREYSPDIFDRYLDLLHIIDPDQRILLKVKSITYFIPEIAHVISNIHGEKGGAKTSLCIMQKRLVDPDASETLTIPRDKNEFVQQLYHNYMPVYDNIKTVPYWFSDEICRAVTGAGNTKRALYTDDDDIVYNYKSCVVVNAIVNPLTEPDALDRCILVELARLKNEDRKEWSEIERQFEQMRPQLLGYIFDTLSKALAVKPELHLNNLPRMADSAVWGEAISRAMGNTEGKFLEAYYRNIGRQNVEAIESNPLAQAVIKFADDRLTADFNYMYENTVGGFFDDLVACADQNKIDSTNKKFPKAPNALSRRLKPILSNLREGYDIEIAIDTITQGEQVGRSGVAMRKISQVSQVSTAGHSHVQDLLDLTRDIPVCEDNTSSPGTISLVESGQDRAQNDQARDTLDTRDDCATTVPEREPQCLYCREKIDTKFDRCPKCATAKSEAAFSKGDLMVN